MLQWHLISRHLLQVWTAWDCSLPFTCNSAAHSSLYLLLPQRKPNRPHQWQVTLLYPVRCAVHLMSVSAASCVVHLTTSLAPSHCCSARIISGLLWNGTKLVSWCSLLSLSTSKGLHRGWKQTSIYLHVTHTTSLFFSIHNSNSIHNFRTQTQTNKTHVLDNWSLFVFRGHSTWEPESSRVTYFLPRAHTGTHVSHS